MYICLDCGCVFEKAKPYREPHGEVTYGCPKCDGFDYTEADRCECGEYKEKSEWLCFECKANVENRFKEFFADQTVSEQNYLKEFLEGY